MSISPDDLREPQHVLLRPFGNDADLLIIFNSKRCRYSCAFCPLPQRSPDFEVAGDLIEIQYRHALESVKSGLGVTTRLTLSNNGSILDRSTFDRSTLIRILTSATQLRELRRIELETRLEFCDLPSLRSIASSVPRQEVGILYGFETLDERLRREVLGKHDSISRIVRGIRRLGTAGYALTAYVIFKPDYRMSDEEAVAEATASIEWLWARSLEATVPLTIRMNPLYIPANAGSASHRASADGLPPNLASVIECAARFTNRGLPVYIGLTDEGHGAVSYRDHPDFQSSTLRLAIEHNKSLRFR